ncbi:MAG: BrnA antitoxin family protein [Bryobacteraceae bacterium]
MHSKASVKVKEGLHRDVCDWLKGYGEGYSTRINSILRAVMVRAR